MKRDDHVRVVAGPFCRRVGIVVRVGTNDNVYVVLDGERQPRRSRDASDHLALATAPVLVWDENMMPKEMRPS